MPPLLSVIIPVYNEAKTIRQILEKIRAVNIDKEVIVIDNGSTDNTGSILKSLEHDNLKVIYHVVNRGKGGALLTGLQHARGELVIFQDGDLEYDPGDYVKLVETMKQGGVDVVLGARFTKGYHGLPMHRLGNRSLTAILNFLFRSDINDYATCYKLAHRETFCGLGLESKSFDIEVEIICKVLKKRLRIREVPISYYPRSYAEGKKIRWFDGLHAILRIVRYRVAR